MYDAIRNTLPTPLSFLYIPNSTVHSHNTRQRHEPHVQARRSMVATNSLTHKAHGIWSATPHQIKELDTRRFLVKGGNSLGEMFHNVLQELIN